MLGNQLSDAFVCLDEVEYRAAFDEREHHQTVNGWFERVARGRSADELIRSFDRAFAAVWQRSFVTLGAVTLTAITERVLHRATAQFPVLASVQITESGLRCQSLCAPGLPLPGVTEALRFVLVELLSVLGNLTAEILTPALQSKLSSDPVSDPSR